MKALIPMLIPLFVSAFRRAEDMADAMEAKCYRGGEGRTKWKIAPWRKCDTLVMIFFACPIFAGSILSRTILGDAMERNIKLTIAYDGSGFVGWQRQPAHHGKSIQQQIEDSLSALLDHKVVIHGAGRTDAGVHAIGQVANFFCDKPLPIDKLADILNNILPSSIRIISAIEVTPEFHARFSPHKKNATAI